MKCQKCNGDRFHVVVDRKTKKHIAWSCDNCREKIPIEKKKKSKNKVEVDLDNFNTGEE